MKIENSIKTIDDIKAERMKLRERRRTIESNFLGSSTNDEEQGFFQSLTKFNSVKNFVFNKFINKNNSSESSITSLPFLNKLSGGKKWGIITLLSSFITHPTAKSALSLTKKSFIKWQIFNASIMLIKWGYNTYKKRQQNKKYEDAIIVED